MAVERSPSLAISTHRALRAGDDPVWRSHITLDETTLQTAIVIAASAARYPAIDWRLLTSRTEFSYRGGSYRRGTLDVLDRVRPPLH